MQLHWRSCNIGTATSQQLRAGLHMEALIKRVAVVGLEGALQVATEPGLELVQDLTTFMYISFCWLRLTKLCYLFLQQGSQLHSWFLQTNSIRWILSYIQRRFAMNKSRLYSWPWDYRTSCIQYDRLEGLVLRTSQCSNRFELPVRYQNRW